MPDASAPASLPALDRILAVAERLFAERGYDSVSISDVARESGVCKANVFHHFAGKQALYEAAVTESCSRLVAEMQRMLGDGIAPDRQIPHFLQWYRRYLREHPATARLLVRELTGNPDLADTGPVFPVLAGVLDTLVAHVGAARDAGVYRANVNPTIVASLLLGITLFNSQTEHLRRRMRAWQDVGDETYVDLLTDVLLRGVLAEQPVQPSHASSAT
jgi:TetR/AcrR family transcriptional regulator